MGWFNYYGLAALAVIMIPNVVYAIAQKGGFSGGYKNKLAEVLEQIGRYGCFVFMIFQIPYTCFGFWFENALTVYLSVNGALCFVYCVCWIVFWRRDGRVRALALSILPTIVFLFSGIVLLNLPLIAFALLFGVNHILISYRNAVG